MFNSETKRHIRAFRRRWYKSPLFWLAFVVVVLVVIRLVLDPIAARYTQKALDGLEGFKGTFDDVHVSVLPPAYEIKRLKIIEEPGGRWSEPLVYVEHAQVGIFWRKLLHRQVVARIRVDEPKLTIVQRARGDHPESAKTKATRVPDLSAQMEKMTPLRIDRVEVRGGELALRDLTQKNHPELWLHDLELVVENIATRAALAEGRPTTVAMTGALQRSGKVMLFVSADPWEKGLNFAGRFELRGLRTAELYALIEAATDLQAPEGTIDLFVEFVAKKGHITGGIKPVLKNVKIAPADSRLMDRLKAWLADKALDVVSDRVPDRNAVATVIPIKGTVENPKAQTMPTVLGIIRNAFVAGLSSGFARLPPPTAEKKQGALEQVKDALQKDKSPPKAQPENKE